MDRRSSVASCGWAHTAVSACAVGQPAGRGQYGQPQFEIEIEERLTALYFEPTRRRYGNIAWDAAVNEGAAMSFEHALIYALEEAHVEAGGG